MLSETQSISNATDMAYPELRSNQPKSEHSSSSFGDAFCGEPLVTQRIMLDFTPFENVDTEFVQKKCCAFWEFLESRRDLQHLMVYPETSPGASKQSSDDTGDIPQITISDNEDTVKQRTAVSMLEIVEEKGLIDRIFEAKLLQSICSLGSREYQKQEFVPSARVMTRKKKIKACKCSGVCKTCRQKPMNVPSVPGSPKLKELCKKMDEWDEKHPKCRPICKNRRREWKGNIHNTSAELLLERKPLPECFRRWPTKVYPNSPCPIFGRTKQITLNGLNIPVVMKTVRVCQASIDDTVATPYLGYVQLAKNIGAWDCVRACCKFCDCGACCLCGIREYEIRDEDRSANWRNIRNFDDRVKHDYADMRIMYDKIDSK